MILENRIEQPGYFGNGRYLVHEQLGKGSMGIVSRASDRLTGDIVALKQIQISPTQLEFSSRQSISKGNSLRKALIKEFQILSKLHHPNIIRVLDFGFDEKNRPYFTMNYLPKAKTILKAAQHLSTKAKIDFIFQTLQALVYLHHQNIFHRDLKPSNIIAKNGVVTVLDFGLAINRDQPAKMAGSLLYMAPELFKQTTSEYKEATDLYSVGVILYELLVGMHPYDSQNPNYVMQLKSGTPNLNHEAIPQALRPIIGRLLQENPEDRYQTSRRCLDDFERYLGVNDVGDPENIRESFLKWGAFVGRHDELDGLKKAVDAAAVNSGSSWLVAGESGSGKSRLIQEVETVALVRGFLVLKGQALDDDGGLPFQVWRAPLRKLLLQLNDVDDATCAVLKMLVPDIGELVGRAIAAAPPLPADAAQLRLLHAITFVFEKTQQPVLLILEDLHWAQESLLPLSFLNRGLSKRPLMIIGSYRSDERPFLSGELSDMTLIQLGRFKRSEIASLSYSMLGKIGRQDKIIDFLARETEGNVFFVVEIVRALIEHAGRWQNIDGNPLPESLFPNGIQNLINNRLKRVPDDAKRLLKFAAVSGREINIELLKQSTENHRLESWWLRVFADAAILEVDENKWRFSHDKIRESILAQIPKSERQQLHAQVATAIEQFGHNLDEQYATLAFHWRKSGNVDQELKYSVLAGKYYRNQFLENEALKIYQRAFDIMPIARTAEKQRENVDVINGLASLKLEKEPQEALALTNQARQLAISGYLSDQPYEAGNSQGQLNAAAALIYQGRGQEALPLLKIAQAYFEKEDEKPLLVKAWTLFAIAYWHLGNVDMAERYILAFMEIGEALNLPADVMHGCLLMGMVCDAQNRPEEEVAYEEKALKISREIGDKGNEAMILNNHGYTLFTRGQKEASLKLIKEALAIGLEINNPRPAGRAAVNLILLNNAYEQYEEAWHYFEVSLDLLKDSGLHIYEMECYLEIGLVCLAQGLPEKALGYLEKAAKIGGTIDRQEILAKLNDAFYQAYRALGDDTQAAKYEHGAAS